MCPPWRGAGAVSQLWQSCLHWGHRKVSSSVSGKWEEGHVSTCSPCKGRAALPKIWGSSLQVGHTAAMETIRSGDQGHGKWWWGFAKVREELELQVTTWEELQQPPASVHWKDSAATTFWGPKHLPALLTVIHTPPRSSQGGARAPKVGQRYPPILPSEQAAGNRGFEPNGKILHLGTEFARKLPGG